MNVDTYYTTTKSDERLRYEENVHDKDEYQNEMKRMMIDVRNHESFEIDIDDDSEKQYAFVKVLRHIRKMKTDEWRYCCMRSVTSFFTVVVTFIREYFNISFVYVPCVFLFVPINAPDVGGY